LSKWAVFRKSKGGVKLHLRLEFHEDGVLPDCAIITQAKASDKTQMDGLVVHDPDAINVFDRGYIDYKKFDSYCENGIRFVSRLKKNAAIEVVEQRQLATSSQVTSDRVVYLGKEGITKMRNPLRLLETVDTEGNPFIIITNNFELDAEEISTIYRNRWQIELFFKWIKQNLCMKHFYGLSRQAVTNQILIALITYCLLMLLKQKTGFNGSLTRVKRLLIICAFESYEVFVRKLLKKPKRRRKTDYETEFRMIERMVMTGNAECFYNQSCDELYV
jgi:IS4 transposase